MTHRNLMFASALFTLLVVGSHSARAQQYAIRAIDVPGAAATQINDTNKSGQIVGCYTTADFSSGRGLVLANATFKTVKYPKAASTCVYGVSNDGKMAGEYLDGSGIPHGFLLVGKTFTVLNYPGAVWTSATKVNNSGVVVGAYNDGTTDHGFMWQSGTFTAIDYPGSSQTFVYGINDSGTIVGNYISGTFHGFS